MLCLLLIAGYLTLSGIACWFFRGSHIVSEDN